MPVAAGVEAVAGAVAVHEVDAAGDGEHALDEPLERLAARVRVARVEAEPGLLVARQAVEGVPEPGERVQPPGHGPVPTGGVLDEDRQRVLHPLQRLAPVGVADLRVVPGEDVATVDHQRLRPGGRGRPRVRVEQLARRDADAVVGRRHVDDVRRVHDEAHARRWQRGRLGALGGSLPALRVAEEQLHEVRAPRRGGGHRVGVVEVGTERGREAGTRGSVGARRVGRSRREPRRDVVRRRRPRVEARHPNRGRRTGRMRSARRAGARARPVNGVVAFAVEVGPGDGLSIAVAVVAAGGVVAMLVRVLRAEAARRQEGGRTSPGYPRDARREHPPVTERP